MNSSAGFQNVDSTRIGSHSKVQMGNPKGVDETHQ